MTHPDDIKFVMNLLRQGSIKWRGRTECLRKARKKVLVGYTKDGKPKYKYHWQCAKCRKWFRQEKQMEVDHIVEIGSFCGDWNIQIPKILTEAENLQALCIGCHMIKTKQYNSARVMYERKKKFSL